MTDETQKQPEATECQGEASELSAVLAGAEQKIYFHLKLGIVLFVLLVLMVAFNVIHWMMWTPALMSNIGLIVSLAMQLNRIDELRAS